MKVSILGRGKVGSALFRAAKASAQIDVTHRKSAKGVVALTNIDLWIVAVPDDQIEAIATTMATQISKRTSIVHCAGSRGIEELAACQSVGASVGVMHPLVSFADKRKGPPLVDKTFVIDGQKRAVTQARKFAKLLGARICDRPADIAAYHAIAALIANGGASLSFVGAQGLIELGIKEKQASHMVAGLLRSVADNIEYVGLPKALTGPVVRGDADAIAKHRQALGELSTQLVANYDRLLPIIVDCAKAAGLSLQDARRILKTMNQR